MKHKLAGPGLMITDQRPGIQPETRIRQVQIVHGKVWHLLKVPAEVIAQIADQAAGKRQFTPGGQVCFPQLGKAFPQALQEVTTTFVR